LKHDGALTEGGGLVTPFAERQRLVGKAHWDAIERRY
jgi:hypothetical protein